jgi:16S rRNA (guanine527-N7)-methyltransferase
MTDIILKYFPGLNSEQYELFKRIESLYIYWNERINVISRKDISGFYERHVLHSLSIAKYIKFLPGTEILDVGTGGGFPGIPLAIYFPEVNFHLIDSTGKKIKVVKAVTDALELKNVFSDKIRVEDLKDKYDFVVSRAVASLSKFIPWVKKNVSERQRNVIPNGILYLKGGDIEKEAESLRSTVFIQNLSEYFDEEFFLTKKLVHIII